MAKIKCIKCGNILSNSSSPSNNIIRIFPDKAVKSVMSDNPNMRFFDFETEKHSEYEYWFCQQCNTVYCIENKPQGSAKLIYSKIEKSTDISDLSTYTWERLWIYSDEELYVFDELEANWNATVSDFFNKVKPLNLYYISPDRKKVVVIDNSTNKMVAVYCQIDFLNYEINH